MSRRAADIAVKPRRAPVKGLWTLVGGLLGFPHRVRFNLIANRRRSDFGWLQSAEDPALAFPVTDPRTHLPDCRYAFSAESLATLDLPPAGVPPVLVTVAVAPDGRLRLNLAGPIVFNPDRRVARQLVWVPENAPAVAVLECSSWPDEKAKAS